MHPLTPDLSKLSMEEVMAKHSDLLKKITMAYRWGNADLVNQLQMVMEDYQSELNERNRRQLEEMQKSSKQFKNIIDIQ
jgi:hypothetical protein